MPTSPAFPLQKYQLISSIKLQQAAKEQAMAGDVAAKEQVAAAKAERDRAAYGGGAVSLLAGGGESPQAAAPPPAPPLAELLPQDGALLGGGVVLVPPRVGEARPRAREARSDVGMSPLGVDAPEWGLGLGGIDDVEELGEDPEDPRGEDEDFGGGGQGDYDDGDESSASGLVHGDEGSDGQGQFELDDEEATELSAGKAGRKVRSGRGGGVRKQKFRGTPGGVSGGSSEIMDLMKMAVTKLVDRPNPQQQPPAPAELDALRAQVAHNTQLAQRSHDMAEQSLQQSQQGLGLLQSIAAKIGVGQPGGHSGGAATAPWAPPPTTPVAPQATAAAATSSPRPPPPAPAPAAAAAASPAGAPPAVGIPPPAVLPGFSREQGARQQTPVARVGAGGFRGAPSGGRVTGGRGTGGGRAPDAGGNEKRPVGVRRGGLFRRPERGGRRAGTGIKSGSSNFVQPAWRPV
ncbi:unnamed protein product [Ectocarpus sp. CCAP 1310/34]|nr:unnamed protein product [Ectocarpus sp. CCAP 1310/34]CAB1109493.1 unnamed protein product [Ectocarpus sp. CCAP 1310/34]